MATPNRLISQTSPYLLQHAHNPIDWYPWGEEALSKAKAERKPILVSIGYSACHWCHVMERESFENEQIAALMNANFVCIKVDREERPDVDAIYMDALHAMGIRGGWPLNVFLLPDARPFYGLTYAPSQNWFRLLQSIKQAFDNQYIELEKADKFTMHLYPNPTTGLLHWDAPVQAPTTVEVYNAMGRLQLRQLVQTSVIDLSALPEGAYYVRFLSEEQKPHTGRVWIIRP